MVFKIGKLLEKGKLKGKGVVDLFHDHEKRIDDLESSGGSGYDDTEIKARITAVENDKVNKEAGKSLITDEGLDQIVTNHNDISALQTAIGDESTPNSILGRIKALEDAS